ncbi:hypothetical protein [Aquimarina aggregata]|uniref:hypothetical protein n=1 Tax=Aquimarina aggregata TaxID=1642818 RepID=UPI0024928307|nr:hypothetical protein [Aquimarina aggregata]
MIEKTECVQIEIRDLQEGDHVVNIGDVRSCRILEDRIEVEFELSHIDQTIIIYRDPGVVTIVKNQKVQ